MDYFYAKEIRSCRQKRWISWASAVFAVATGIWDITTTSVWWIGVPIGLLMFGLAAFLGFQAAVAWPALEKDWINLSESKARLDSFKEWNRWK